MAPGYPDSPVELRSSNGSAIVDESRSSLAFADSALWLVGMTGDELDRFVSENSLAETQRAIGNSLNAARQLRTLADSFDVARVALRDSLESAIREHDKQQAHEQDVERPQLVPASSVRQGQTGPAPTRG
jgi:hypothetical protein